MILALGICLIALAGWTLYLAVSHGHALALRRQRTAGLCDAHGFAVQPRLFYHPGHTWIAAEADDTVRVGLDDFARRLVDGIRAVALPAPGAAVREGMAAIGIDCGSKRAALLCPVDGIVTSINPALARGGAAVERDPYGKGWLFTVRVTAPRYAQLPTGSRAVEWLDRESGRLSVFLNAELGTTAADGGELIARSAHVLDKEHWDTLVHTFLGAATDPVASAAGKKGAES